MGMFSDYLAQNQGTGQQPNAGSQAAQMPTTPPPAADQSADSTSQPTPTPQATPPQQGGMFSSYLASKNQPSAANPPAPTDAAQQYQQTNPATPLSAAVLGFEQGATYNGAKKIAQMSSDPTDAAAFDVNAKQYPLTSALGQLVGAVLAPSPIGKLSAIKEAGTLAKMAFNAADFTSRVGLSGILGSDDPTLAGKAADASKQFQNPLTLGLGALSTLAPALPTILKTASGTIVKNGDVSVGLGKGMEDALGSEAGQAEVSRAVKQFESDTMQAGQKGIDKLGQTMDQIASQNSDTTLDTQGPMSKLYDFISGQKPDELLDKDRVAIAKLKNFVDARDSSFNTADNAGSENTSFTDAYQMKKDLGRMLFDPQTGNARTFNSADPSIKAAGIKLYSSLADGLSKADKTKTFSDVSDAFTGVYKTIDAADDIGNSLSSMADKLNVNSNGKRDAILDAFKTIPPQYLPAVPELSNQIVNQMDKTITAYNIAAKIKNGSPAKSNVLWDNIMALPIVSEGSRLDMLNQLGQTSSGAAPTGAFGGVMKAGSALSAPQTTSGLNNTARSLRMIR